MIHVHVEVEKNTNSVMVNKTVVTLVLGLFSFLTLGAQVVIKEEPKVTKLMQVYKSTNQQEPIVKAWRIQIIATSNRSEMEKTISRFERLYPHINYDWEHNAPYYQVKIGAYEKKRDLEAFILELKKEFPMSIPVQDEITKKELIGS